MFYLFDTSIIALGNIFLSIRACPKNVKLKNMTRKSRFKNRGYSKSSENSAHEMKLCHLFRHFWDMALWRFHRMAINLKISQSIYFFDTFQLSFKA